MSELLKANKRATKWHKLEQELARSSCIGDTTQAELSFFELVELVERAASKRSFVSFDTLVKQSGGRVVDMLT